MGKFIFEARNPNGKSMQGEIEAASEAEARVKLRAQRLVPVKVVLAAPGASVGGAKKSSKTSVKIKPKDLQILTRQMATLFGAGIPILQSVDTLSQSARSPGVSYVLKTIAADISKGKRLADALGEHPGMFNRFYVNMVRAGEESGNLDQILQRLATYIEKSVKLVGKVKGALAYPLVVLVIALLVVVGLLVFVIPKFQQLFAQMGSELPALTQLVISMSNFAMSYWWVGLTVIGGTGYFLNAYYQTEEGRKQFDRIFIDLPLFGSLIQKSAVARFTRTLSTLLGSGVNVMEAMEISARTVGNSVIENAILRARDSISEGKSLTVQLSKEKFMPQMVVQMIGIGEQTGTLDQMLGRIADFYEDEVDVAVSTLTSMIEPLLMVFLGGIVAFLVIAMYLPIFNIANTAG